MKQINNLSKYFIHSNGSISNAKSSMRYYVNNSGYAGIKLINDEGTREHWLIHRLIATAFIPNNDDTLNTVNHKDGNRLNNNVSNLEWVSMSEQHYHAYRVLGRINPCSTKGKKHKSQVSKYHNVGYDKGRNKWVAVISINNKGSKRKRFNTEEEAALYVNYLLDYHGITDRPKNII